MKYLLALMLLFLSPSAWAISMTQADCSWDRPGANPYTGNVSDGIDYYLDIPRDVRAVLKYRIINRHPDEVVGITKNKIFGKESYSPVIEQMHFGPNKICTNISRNRWPDTMVQEAEVYCEGTHCVIIPFICGNISRVKKIPDIVDKPIFEIPKDHGSSLVVNPTPVPEPGSIALLMIGVASLAVVSMKKRKEVL